MNTTTYSSRNAMALGIPDLSPNAFGGDLPPFARKEMVKALGMHYEKSKGLRSIVSIAASIAIPMAAPSIAASIGLSTALAGTIGATAASAVGSALVGAGLGAASALLTKQKIGQSMLMGAIGGGISGYFNAPNTPSMSANATSLANTPAGSTQVGIANLGDSAAIVTPVQGANGTQWTIMNGPNAGSIVDASQVGYGGAISTDNLANVLSSGGDMAQQAQSIANTLSNTGTLAVNTPTAMGGNATALGTSNFYNPNAVGTAGTAGTTAAQTFAPQTAPAYSSAGLQVTPAAQQAAAAATAPQQPTSAWDALKQKVSDPKMQADLVLRAAGQLAGSLTAGSGLSPEQEELVKQQKAELAMLQQTNRGLFEQRLREATALLGEAKYFDPNYFGMMAQRSVTTGIGRQAQENLRDIAPQRGGLRTAEQRRYNLEAATRGETAYLQGATTAQQNKLQTTQAGLAALPTSGPNTYGTYGGGFSDTLAKAEEQRRKAAEDIGALFGSLTGPGKATSLG